MQLSSAELSASGSSSTSGSERESSPPSEGGDTEPVHEDTDDNDDSCISESPPCSQVPSVLVSEGMSAWPLAVKSSNCKGCLILNSHNIVDILKKKVSVQQRNLK